MKIQVIIHEAEEGGFWAEVPALPGCVTEADIGQELVEKGVPASDIILGLHPPYKRPYTNYGVA